MAGKKLTEMSNDDLLKKHRMLKMIVYITIAPVIMLFVGGFWLTFAKHKFSAIIVVAITSAITLIANTIILKSLQKEIKSRGL